MTEPAPSEPQASPPYRDTGASRRSRGKARRIFRWSVVALLALAVSAGIWYRIENPPLLEVTAGEVTEGPLIAEWAATGYVEGRAADVSSPATGRVQWLEAREGDPVRKGQVLARLSTITESAAVETQRRGVAVAKAEVEASEASVSENARVLADRVTAAAAEVEAARAAIRESEVALDREKRLAAANLRAARAEEQAVSQQLRELRNGARPQEILQAEAALADAEAVRQRAQIERDRQATLVREKAAARRALEDALEALTRSEAQVRRSEAALSLLRQGPRPETIAAAEARVRAAEERVSAAEAELAGVDVLARRVDQMRAGAKAAEAGLAEARSAQSRVQTLDRQTEVARTKVQQAEAGTREAQAHLSDKVVYAPFDGTIGRRLADPGDLAVPGKALFTVVESARSWIEAEVDEQDLAAVRLGQTVALSIPSLPGQSFTGTIERIGAQAIPQLEQTRTSARIVRVRVSLTGVPAEGRALFKPGVEVDVTGRTTLSPRAVLAPTEAIRADSNGSYVLALSDGEAVRRDIRTGHAFADVTQILDGIEPGDRVILTAPDNVAPGMKIRARGDSR